MSFQVGDRIQGVDEYSFLSGVVVSLYGPNTVIIDPDSYENPFYWAFGIRWYIEYEWIELESHPAQALYEELFL
jgi:hypothetical protein